MNSIAIIPARGGSKRIPRKNIRDFLGKPIIAYSIEAALESGVFDVVMVSTDDEEIADVSKKYGADVPFFRSPEMSDDMAMTAPVLIEVINEYKKRGVEFAYTCCIYPCAPFITPERLREGKQLLITFSADSVFPVAKISLLPQKHMVIRDGKLQLLDPETYDIRSQDLEAIYHDAAQFYFVKTNTLLAEETLLFENMLPLIISESELQDIDTEDDWIQAEIKYKILKNMY